MTSFCPSCRWQNHVMIFSPNESEYTTVLDLDSGFVARGTWVPDSISCITDYNYNYNSISKNFPDSGIRILLHGA